MRRPVIAVLAMAMAATGCVAEAPGQPVPTADDTTTPTSQSQSGGKAPPINAPELHLASYESRVCELLTSAQLAQLDIRGRGKPSDGASGPACKWNPPDSSVGARIDLAILSKAQGGWDGVYDRRRSFAFFEEAGVIKGYPAVHRDVDGDHTDQGICATTVGVRRDLVFDVGVFVNGRESPEYKKACSVSDRVAGLVIDTLRGGR
jgi:Protein of unknown function (DUF3558)